MHADDVAELLRATASDAGAVAQYLRALDGDELNALLDRFAAHEAKQKAGGGARSDWLALVQLLLRAESARLRTATRIIQLVWNGAASELEGMQWLTEISLGYLGAAQDAGGGGNSDAASLRARVRLGAVAGEVRVLLRVLFELLRDGIDAHASANPRKVLPLVLGLLPILLGVLAELTSGDGTEKSGQELRENVATLLELPWTSRTVPLLLDLLRESAAIVSPSGWSQLQENVERMVAGGDELPSESMNAILRECVLIGSVTRDCHWVGVARRLLRQLPPRLRQEAEFNLQMCLHQSPDAVALVCASIRLSLESESSGVDESELPGGERRLALDWRDVLFLFHALQVSRPVLHHRTTSSRIATDATIFAEIETLTWAILRLDLARHHCAPALAAARSQSADLAKHMAERVSQLLAFGGTQVHSREWKALLLMDFALYWMEDGGARECEVVGLTEREAAVFREISDSFPSRDALARALLLAVFQAAPEVRSEMLSNLFEGTKSPERVQFAGRALDQLFRSHPSALLPHLNAIQDWLSALFLSHFGCARAFFLMASQLVPTHKDLYSFLMVFLRKLLSVSSLQHQKFAIDLWCSWLEQGLRFDAQQEEEIVSVLKNSLLVCQGARAWTLGRLTQMFQPQLTQLRRSSWEELHRVLLSEISQFIRPATSLTDRSDFECSDDDDDDDDDGFSSSQSQRFQVDALDQFYRQNTSADGAAAVGLVFQKVLSCLLLFESAAAQPTSASDGQLSLSMTGAGVLRWITGFVANREFFFHWISQSDGDDASDCGELQRADRQQASGSKALSKKAVWRLLSRIGVGSALCSVAIEQLLREQRREDTSNSHPSGESLWSLLEVQLCLHRLLRKLVTVHGATIDVKQSKEYLSSSFYGISSVLDGRSAQILEDVSSGLSRDLSSNIDADGDGVESSSGVGEISLDSLLFVLDSCSNNAVGSGRSPVSPAPAHTYKQRASADRVGVLRALLRLYATVQSHALSNRSSVADGVSKTRPVFTVYSESLVLKFPKALRHIVGTPNASKLVVLLDAKAAESILVRVFAAVGRVVDSVVDIVGAEATDREVHAAVAEVGAFGVESGERGGLVALAAVLVRDLEGVIARQDLAKLKVASAMLAKRLYDILCDHMVYHAPLLRTLLGICLSTHFGKSLGSVVALAGRVEGFLRASGFKAALLAAAPVPSNAKVEQAESTLSSASSSSASSSASSGSESCSSDEMPTAPTKRRRLRQSTALRSAAGAVGGSSVRSHDGIRVFHAQPHLSSSDAQSAAIQALLTLLDAAQSTLFRQLASMRRRGGRDTERLPSTLLRTATQYARLNEHVLRALLDSTDASWVNAKVLAKLLSVVEWSLRIGKLCGGGGGGGAASVTSKRVRGASAGWRGALIDVLDSSVQIGIQGRVWVNLFKESVKESSTKSRLSATSLKIDVFLLDVPQLLESFVKETRLSDSQRERIRAMLSLITDHMTPAVESSRAASKKHVHMIGVVPIVKKRKRRLRSRHPYIDDWLRDEDGSDAYADLEDFIE